MTQYIALEPWAPGETIIGANMKNQFHDLHNHYNFFRMEVRHNAVIMYFEGLEGASTPNLLITFSGVQKMVLEADPEPSGGHDFTEFHYITLEKLDEAISEFTIYVHDFHIILSATAVEARYGQPD